MKRFVCQSTILTVLVLALSFSASAQSLEDTALLFDGNDRALVPDSAVPTLASSFTIEAWVYLNTISQHHAVIDLSNDFDFLILSGGKMEINASSGFAITGNVVPAGSWQHVAVVADAADNSYRLYLNGNQAGSGAYSPAQHSGRLNIGARDSGRPTQVYTNGMIDEVRIWNTARTQQEIADNRSTELATLGRHPFIAAYYPIRASGSTLDDWNGNADGSIGTAVRVTPGAPFIAPDSDGDGVPDYLDLSPMGSDGAADLDGDGIIDAMATSTKLLTAVLSVIEDPQDANAVEDAIAGLEKAMDPVLWSDASTLQLDAKMGTKAFDGTKKAVKKLASVSTSSTTPIIGTVSNAVKEIMKETSTRSIDRAKSTCDDTPEPRDQTRCQNSVDQATSLMAKATGPEEEGKFDKAIDLYRQAWRHTETAGHKALAKTAVAEAVSPVARPLSVGVSEVPLAIALEGNYPNPFNPTTTIRFGLPETMDVQLEVFDMLGRKVRVLVDGPLAAGYHDVEFDAGRLSSGTYMYRLRTGTGVLVNVMHLFK